MSALRTSGPLLGWRWLAVWLAWLVLAGGLSGCAGPGVGSSWQGRDDFPAHVEWEETPFFPDEGHYCGPAALATSLTAAGFPVRPEALIEQVYVPGRQGSLQIEMLAAARRHGAVSMVLPDDLEALLRETAAGHPVVVLQNLGLSWAPSWHYAVVIGYDLAQELIYLRSGPMRRQALSMRTFQYTWDRSGRWAFVSLPPGELPVTVTQAQATQALMAFERIGEPAAAVKSYRRALDRWPNSASLAMGLGNALYKAGQKSEAGLVFGELALTHPSMAAYNNLAQVLLELGQLSEARRVAEKGLQMTGEGCAKLRETLQEILAAERMAMEF